MKILNLFKSAFKKLNRTMVIRICNLLSVPLQFLGCAILYFVIEALSRHSMAEAWKYMTGSPLIFLYNTFLIFVTTLPVYLFRSRILVRLIIGTFWMILGCINGFLLLKRVTPFTGPDLRLMSDAIKIMNKYLSSLMVGVVLVFLGLLVLLYIWMFFKGWKYRGKIRYWINIPLIILTIVLFYVTTNLALEKRVISSYFGNIAHAYEDYGYPYCLGITFFDTGINEPNGYCEDLIQEIVKSEGKIKKTKQKNLDVNIVFLQLETFIDPTEINFLEFSKDPTPYFRELTKKYSSGYFKVPAVGAGTANTEFETITGMSLHYFGAGEYPYKTILKEKTCESAAYVLKELGYGTHAIHNNEANFYGRRSVFSMLGFDTFTSEEYMPDISDATPMGWVKDHILTDEILTAMKSTESPDYVYTISVQGHGDYPSEPLLENPEIKVSGAESEERNTSWEYYVNQLYEMDQFLKELTTKLEEFDERTVLVVYGDHLPTMDLKVEDMKNRYLFQTKYVIWSNFEMEKKDKNLAAYQMGAEVFNRLGIHEGTLFNYHQTRKGSRNYQVDLQALQYDILYGNRYIYHGENPYERSKMQMGVRPIELFFIKMTEDNNCCIYGHNFTASSRLEVNGELKDTIFLNTNELLIQDITLEDGDEVCIATQSNSPTKRVLTRSQPITYRVPGSSLSPEPTTLPSNEEE